MDKKKIIYDFLENHKLAVLSTINADGNPQSALVGFGQNENLELFFGTSKLSRKYKNLIQNPKVSVVIGWENSITLQYEGEAKESNGPELEKFKEAYFRKNPLAKQFENDPYEVYFKIKPKWIRYTKLKDTKLEVFEVIF